MLEEKIDQLNANLQVLIQVLTNQAAVHDQQAADTGTSAGLNQGTGASGKKASGGSKKTGGSKKASGSGKGAVKKKDVADMVLKVVDQVSREAAVQVLNNYDAGKVPDLDESDYQAVYDELKAALAGSTQDPEEEDDLTGGED